MNKNNIVEEQDVLYHYDRHYPAVRRVRAADGSITGLLVREAGSGTFHSTYKFMREVHGVLGYRHPGFLYDPRDAQDLEACRALDAFLDTPGVPALEQHEAMRPYARWLGAANRHGTPQGCTLKAYLGGGHSDIDPLYELAAEQLTSKEPLDWKAARKKWPANWIFPVAYGIHNIPKEELPLLLVQSQEAGQPDWFIDTITKRLNNV